MCSRRLSLAFAVVLGGACGQAESTGYHPGVTEPEPDAGAPGTGGWVGGRRGTVPVVIWDAGEGTGGAGPAGTGGAGGAPGTGGTPAGTGGQGTGGAPGTGGMPATGGAPGAGGSGAVDAGSPGTGGSAGMVDAAPPVKQLVAVGNTLGINLATHCQSRGYSAVAQPRNEVENVALITKSGGAGAWLGIKFSAGAWRYLVGGAPIGWAKWAPGEPRTGNPMAMLSEGAWWSTTDDQEFRVYCER
jgi:hypothetical protein